jgi:hypothetical protein
MEEKLVEYNTRLCPTLNFPRDGSPSFMTASITCEKIDRRNRKKASALATFCPFCGVRYVEEPRDGLG